MVCPEGGLGCSTSAMTGLLFLQMQCTMHMALVADRVSGNDGCIFRRVTAVGIG